MFGDEVYVSIIQDAKAKRLISNYTDSVQVYDVIDISEFHYKRVNHSKAFVSKRNHRINNVEKFLNLSK
jgi:transposase